MVLNLGWEKIVTHKIIPLFIIQPLLTNSNSCHIFHVSYPSINILLMVQINQSKRTKLYTLLEYLILYTCVQQIRFLVLIVLRQYTNILHTYEN